MTPACTVKDEREEGKNTSWDLFLYVEQVHITTNCSNRAARKEAA